MTYEEQILRNAEIKCNKLYVAELLIMFLSLMIMLLYVFSEKYEILYISSTGFIISAILEAIAFFVERKAKKHTDRRLAVINSSLLNAIEHFPQTELSKELDEFEKEYGFLEEK